MFVIDFFISVMVNIMAIGIYNCDLLLFRCIASAVYGSVCDVAVDFYFLSAFNMG